MSDRNATTPPGFRRAAPAAGKIVAFGVFAVIVALTAGGALAQPQPTGEPGAVPRGDRNSPLPADSPAGQSFAKFAIPDPDRKIFAAVEDFKPVASEVDNALEYLAWCEFVRHANQFAAAELEQHGLRDLTALDLIKSNREAYRRKVICFEGRLVGARRLEVPASLRGPDGGIGEMYEARLVPVDESPLTPVSIVFTELPEALAAVRDKPVLEWVKPEAWARAAGYYFKTVTVPDGRGGATNVPVLVGKGVTVLPGAPVAAGDDPTKIDKNLRIFNFIRDKQKVASRPKLTDFATPWEEAAAYDFVVRHAARFSAAELEAHARADLKFADLFLDASHPGYRLDLVKVEGRLISLRRFEPGEAVQSAGIGQLYEGWLVPNDEPSGNPVCLLFTEPLEGVEPGGRVNVWASFAGYSFKKMRYESAEADPDNPKKNLDKFAPLLIGKRPIPRRDPQAPTPLSWDNFLLGAVALGVVVIAGGGGLAWWYRRGDRESKESIATARGRNPFGE